MTADPPHDQGAPARRASEWIARRTSHGETLIMGCADPTLTLELARAGARVTAFDPNEEAVERVRSAIIEAGVRVRIEHVQAAVWPFPDVSFDAVVLDRTLEHQLRPERTLDEATRVLRAEGTLAVCARYGLSAHADHADALYLRRFVDLLDGRFTLDIVELVDGLLLATARPGSGAADPGALLAVAEGRLAEVDLIAYRLQREAEAERARADRLETTVRSMRASRGWQLARALREGSRSPGKLPRLLAEAVRRKS